MWYGFSAACVIEGSREGACFKREVSYSLAIVGRLGLVFSPSKGFGHVVANKVWVFNVVGGVILEVANGWDVIVGSVAAVRFRIVHDTVIHVWCDFKFTRFYRGLLVVHVSEMPP